MQIPGVDWLVAAVSYESAPNPREKANG